METPDSQEMVTLEELLVSSLATADALAKLLIEKKLITDGEFKRMLGSERATWLGVLRKKISF